MQYSYILWVGPGSVPSRFDLNLKLLPSPKVVVAHLAAQGPNFRKRNFNLNWVISEKKPFFKKKNPTV